MVARDANPDDRLISPRHFLLARKRGREVARIPRCLHATSLLTPRGLALRRKTRKQIVACSIPVVGGVSAQLGVSSGFTDDRYPPVIADILPRVT